VWLYKIAHFLRLLNAVIRSAHSARRVLLSSDVVLTSTPITFSFSTSRIFLFLPKGDPVQQFEAELNAPKNGNGFTVGANSITIGPLCPLPTPH
jgi:hypothetical protein